MLKQDNSLSYLDFFCLRAHVQYHSLLKSVSYDKNRKKVIGIPLTYLEFLGVVLDIQVEQLGGVITDYSIEFNHELMVKMPKEIWSWLDLY